MKLRDDLPPPPDAAYHLVREMHTTFRLHEKRRGARYPVASTILVDMLDEASRPRNEPFLAVLRDISANGISFVHTRAITPGLMRIEFADANDRMPALVIRQVRCEPYRTFYIVAGQIVGKGAPGENGS